MKKIVLCVLFVVFLGKFCDAQSLRLGVKGGLSIPNLKASGDNPVSKGWSSRLGPYAGIIAEYGLVKRLYLQAELNYSSQGGKKNGTQTISSSRYKDFFPPGSEIPKYFYAVYNNEVKLDYIELPVMVKMDFPIGEKFSFFVNAGLYASYLVSAKSITSGSSNVYSDEKLTQPVLPAGISFDANTDVKNDLKNFNFGIEGGVGLSLNFYKENKLFFSAGGNYGFIPIQKDENNGKSNTGAATITLGYLIKL